MTDQTIISELHTLPENLKKEVLHYIQFLKQKQIDHVEIKEPHRTRRAGSAKGKFIMAEDFDGPLEDFAEYM